MSLLFIRLSAIAFSLEEGRMMQSRGKGTGRTVVTEPMHHESNKSFGRRSGVVFEILCSIFGLAITSWHVDCNFERELRTQ